METQQRDFAKTTHHSSKDKVLKSGRIAGRTLWFCSFFVRIGFHRSYRISTSWITSFYTGWWFGTFVIFPCTGNNNPNWGRYTTNQSRLSLLVFNTFLKLLAGTFARLEIPSILTRSDILERRVAQALLVEILHWKYVVWKKRWLVFVGELFMKVAGRILRNVWLNKIAMLDYWVYPILGWCQRVWFWMMPLFQETNMSPHFMSDAIELQMLANNHLLKLTGIPRHTIIL